MCLILFALRAHPRYPLVIAANRDEFYARPTRDAAWWADAPGVYAGRDERGGGTWLGVTRAGRWGAVTNYRDPATERADAPSRGHLVADYLRGSDAPERYLQRLAPRAGEYNGFNLLVGTPTSAWWLSNHGAGARPVEDGVHGLSNHLLDTPWPKVERGRRDLARVLSRPEVEVGLLLDVLLVRDRAPDAELPDTGVEREWERALSAAFIQAPGYGTRSSTALLFDGAGRVRFVERVFRPGTLEFHQHAEEFRIGG